jgi:DNA polymerase III sliding clamp (beta) subunit (PCNA family)
VLETAELARAAKLANYFTAAAANVVKLTLEPGDAQTPGRLTISSNAAEVGEHTGVVDAIVQGASGQILLNAALLAEAIGTIATPQIAVEIQTPQQPALFTPVGVEGFIYLMTPMTLR